MRRTVPPGTDRNPRRPGRPGSAQRHPLTALFQVAGLAGVRSTALDVPTVFADFADYWLPPLGGQGPASGYCVRRPEPARDRLGDQLRASLPTHADGSITLSARAGAVRGDLP